MWHTGLVALQHVGSSRTRDQTRVLRIGRQMLNHWTTKEVQDRLLKADVNSEDVKTLPVGHRAACLSTSPSPAHSTHMY